MKNIRDDANYAEHERVINELAAKLGAVEKEAQAIEHAIYTYSTLPGDPVEAALRLELGIAPQKNSDADRLPVLRAQAEQIRRAIELKTVGLAIAGRDAGHRVFASNASAYLGHTSEMLGLVDRIIELNRALIADQRALRDMGCMDIPEIQFPNFGLSEQFASYWRSDLFDQQQLCKHIVRMHSK